MSRLLNRLLRHDPLWDPIAVLIPLGGMAVFSLTLEDVADRDIFVKVLAVYLMVCIVYGIIRFWVIVRDNRVATALRSPHRRAATQHLRHAVRSISGEAQSLSSRDQEILLRETFESVLRERFGS